MKLLFKQRLFSWFDSYDVTDHLGQPVFTVKGELAWGHCLKIYDANNREAGTVREKVLTWLPKFALYQGDRYLGCIRKEFTFFRPRFHVDFCGWQVEGDFFEWDYRIVDAAGRLVATVTKELFNWTDTYSIEVERPEDSLYALMLVLAIDAEKCSRRD